MRACANCGHENRPGVFFCENCGASLIGKTARDTGSLQASAASAPAGAPTDASPQPDPATVARSVFRDGGKLKLEIEGSPEPLTIGAEQEIIFGRRDPATGALPDVDLTPHAGYRMGVSRRHAAIRQGAGSTLDIWDLGSSNGTFLNGQRLSAHRPYRLHDADELRLGQMLIRVRFEAATASANLAPKPAESAAAPGPPLEAEGLQNEPPSTEPIYALIAMLQDQDAAADSVGATPITEPLPKPEETAPTESEKPGEVSAEKASQPATEGEKPELPTPADKLATEEAEPAAPPSTVSTAVTPPPAAVPRSPAVTPAAPPNQLPKSPNGPGPAEAKQPPIAAPHLQPAVVPITPRNGQAGSHQPTSTDPTTTASEAKAENAPTASDEKPPEEKDSPKPAAPPAPTE